MIYLIDMRYEIYLRYMSNVYVNLWIWEIFKIKKNHKGKIKVYSTVFFFHKFNVFFIYFCWTLNFVLNNLYSAKFWVCEDSNKNLHSQKVKLRNVKREKYIPTYLVIQYIQHSILSCAEKFMSYDYTRVKER